MVTPTRTTRYGTTPAPRTGSPAEPKGELARNPGMPLDLGWVRDVRINRSAVERRAATIPTRRSVKTAWQAGGLPRATPLTDHTPPQADGPRGRVFGLPARPGRPVEKGVLGGGGVGDQE